MTPIVKELENLTAVSSPAVPSAAGSKPGQETVARQQPVPLEVSVTVNGARTIDGSDKREPFSESTKTVLVFSNGAVIRLASSVAPGQLLFVTNEKSKKEVVCQVVKSRNDGKSSGYVELEFTEPAIGFWGIRVPAEPLPAASVSAPKAPVAARPTAPATVPAPAANLSPTALPKFPSPAPLPPATKPVTESSALPAEAPAPEISSDELKQQAARLQEQLNALLFREAAAEKANAEKAAAEKRAAERIAVEKAATERIEADRLQAQKRAAEKLAEEKAAELRAAEERAATEKAAIRAAADAGLVKASQSNSETGRQATELAEADVKQSAASESARVPSAGPTAADPRPQAIPLKAAPLSLPVEEVKIPAWLAPLARESETAGSEAPAHSAADAAMQATLVEMNSEPVFQVEPEVTKKSEAVLFGGQLLGGTSESVSGASGSSRGLWIGLAAAAVLLAGAAVWYGKQPGNFLASAAAPSRAVESTPQPNESSLKPEATAGTVPANASAAASSAAAKPAYTPPQPAANFTGTPNLSINNRAASAPSRTAAPAAEEVKKPVLGDVRLSTPTVNRGTSASASEAAPAIENSPMASSGDPLAGGLPAGRDSGPALPLPVGGDVKPAHILKSTPPIYPAVAKTQRISGDVKIDALIDATGSVASTKIISGPPLLHQAAMLAVKQWKYEAALLDGKPTSMHLTVTVQFRLQ